MINDKISRKLLQDLNKKLKEKTLLLTDMDRYEVVSICIEGILKDPNFKEDFILLLHNLISYTQNKLNDE